MISNDQNELISVIVPVYKVELYLDRCVQSIVDQTYKNLEIILVDDGSPDNCPAMCDAWAERDDRIRVIHQENSGAGIARNHGMANGNGAFFAFVDSDDYLSPQMYEHLMSMIDEETDIVECEYMLVDHDDAAFDEITERIDVISCDNHEAMKACIANCRFRQSPVNKLYRRSVISGVTFPQGKTIDDEFWTYKTIANARKLKSSDLRLYAYRQQPASVMHNLDSNKRLQVIEAKQERLSYLKTYMPELEITARIDIVFSCLYQGQKLLAEQEGKNSDLVMKSLEDTCRKEMVSKKERRDMKLTHRFWFWMAERSFETTCRIRNSIGIGK